MRVSLLVVNLFTFSGAYNSNFFQNYIENYLNHSINPCDDFFDHVCSAAPPEEYYDQKIPLPMKERLIVHMSDYCKEIFTASEFVNQQEPIVFPNDEAKKLEIRKTCSDNLSRCKKVLEHLYSEDESLGDMPEDEIIERIFNWTLSHQNESTIKEINKNIYSIEKLCLTEGLYRKIEANATFLADIEKAEARADLLINKMKTILIEHFNETKWMQRSSSVEKFQKLIGDITRIKFLNETYRPNATEVAKKISVRMKECLQVIFHWNSMEIHDCIASALEFTKLEIEEKLGHEWESDLQLNPVDQNAWYSPDINKIGFTMLSILDGLAGEIAELGTIGSAIGHELAHAVFMNITELSIENLNCIRKHREQICSVSNYTCHMGAPTLEEDAADIMALPALLEVFQQEKEQLNDNPPRFSKEQYFFYTFTAVYCTDQLDHYMEDDEPNRHSPNKGRMNALLMHSESFHKAFSCKKGDGMWKEPDHYCHLLGSKAVRR